MKSLSVQYIRNIINGTLVHGSDEEIVKHCAYRLKQIKNTHTVFFATTLILNWDKLSKFFPLIIVTTQPLNTKRELENLSGLTIIQVENLDQAYWSFIHHYRSMFELPVIAITGTSGKTTTKEMTKYILEQSMNVVATKSSNNSRTAHVQYLFSIDERTEAAVFETAVGAPGDILTASKYYEPTIGIITNIGTHHLNYCKTINQYILAKAEMADAIAEDGTLILNADDKYSNLINLTHFKGKIVKIGKKAEADYFISDIHFTENGMNYSLTYKNQTYSMFVPGFGEHQVYNAVCAIAAVHELGISIEEANSRLEAFPILRKHLQFFEGVNGATIIDDTWSSTTTSIEAAVNVLCTMGKGKQKIVVISSLTDLGSWGYYIHDRAGDMIAKKDIDILITMGFFAKGMAKRALSRGFKGSVKSFGNSNQVVRYLKKIINDQTLVLIKGDMYAKEPKEIAAKLIKKS
ncbi:Mur ligase family protein [Bacillus sp. 31A1R]|uniref:Mur ligase family protein n=1 Tax=Robertmurraya mangrovi TaxID=3098077 RepID=A0ABU5J0V1_9BACI|nr:Mur ligase family protein [Bacillus sp. 31A1R]MDZ5472997.1 Mur ligase family protein [Bacillus sp. 31A1R]